jgi:hypothetical protein
LPGSRQSFINVNSDEGLDIMTSDR